MKKSGPALALFVLMSVLVFASCSAPPGGFAAAPIEDGCDLVRAMHGRYAGNWYDKLNIRQRVTFYRSGKVDREEVWTEVIDLPGRVRSTIGEPGEGNCEIYRDGAFHIFRDGRQVSRREQVHCALLLGFDVYLQNPGRTIDRLKDAAIDLSKLRESVWCGRPVYIVGDGEGDLGGNRFWIDREHLLFVRLTVAEPEGREVEIEFNDYQPFGGVWIAKEVVFRRKGKLLLREEYLNCAVLDLIDPEVFNVEDFKAVS